MEVIIIIINIKTSTRPATRPIAGDAKYTVYPSLPSKQKLLH
jgi:hypothetical protein